MMSLCCIASTSWHIHTLFFIVVLFQLPPPLTVLIFKAVHENGLHCNSVAILKQL